MHLCRREKRKAYEAAAPGAAMEEWFMNEQKSRAQWGSKLGFLMAAVGSAVGLGNIWGFPYKMGKSGGFAFLLVYLVLAATVGFVIMIAELAMGRRAGKGIIGSYAAACKKSKWIGALGVLSPFLILTFYCVLGAYCMQYMFLNFSELAMGVYSASAMTGADSFSAMITNPLGCIIFTGIFVILNILVVQKGVSGGIEKFNTVGMPALFFMLIVIIIRSVTLPGAAEGLKFMFAPNFESFSSFGGFVSVLATAGGQMFFSLSLAMGAMMTYGSYLSKEENIPKNAATIVFFDTLVALMAGMAVLPAAFALGGDGAAMQGPKLLFITMQDVFSNMGVLGPIFGIVFYGLVIIAALSSSISLIEVLVTYVCDTREQKNKPENRKQITWIVCGLMTIGAFLVAWDGLGSNGLWVPFQKTFGIIGEFNDCWLDFFDFISEGVAMPLGAFLMSVLIGWIVKPKYVLDELGSESKVAGFFRFCIKWICPIAMLFILAGQLSNFLYLGWF